MILYRTFRGSVCVCVCPSVCLFVCVLCVRSQWHRAWFSSLSGPRPCSNITWRSCHHTHVPQQQCGCAIYTLLEIKNSTHCSGGGHEPCLSRRPSGVGKERKGQKTNTRVNFQFPRTCADGGKRFTKRHQKKVQNGTHEGSSTFCEAWLCTQPAVQEGTRPDKPTRALTNTAVQQYYNSTAQQ